MNADKELLGRFWDEITPKLYGYLINTLKNPALADDILQNTWLKAMEAMPRYEDRGHFSAWLFMIAKNEMRMHWRTANREIEYNPEIHKAEQAGYSDGKIFVEQVIARLSPEDQELVRFRYIADMSFGEIAKVLNLNPVNVRVKMHRVLKSVRDIIKSQNYE